MELVLDIVYSLLLTTCLVLAYLGCRQDMENTIRVQKVCEASKETKINKSKKNVSETYSTVLEAPPSYRDVIG